MVKQRRKPSDFGIQLMAKQKLKGHYGYITENNLETFFLKLPTLREIQVKISYNY